MISTEPSMDRARRLPSSPLGRLETGSQQFEQFAEGIDRESGRTRRAVPVPAVVSDGPEPVECGQRLGLHAAVAGPGLAGDRPPASARPRTAREPLARRAGATSTG